MSRIFETVQRINGVLILLLLLAAGVILIWNLLPRSERPQRGEVRVAGQTDEGADGAARLHFGELRTIAGTNVQMLRLEARTTGGKFSSGGRSDTRNVLFLTGESKGRWLFPKHTSLILEAHQMAPDSRRDDERFERKERTRLLYFEFVSKDTDGDGRLTREDDTTVALSRPDGTGLTEILHGVDRVLSRELLGERELGIVYQKGKTLLYGKYAVDTFRRISEQTVMELPERL